MKTGTALGIAIKDAIEKKIDSGKVKTKAQIAEHFGIKPPSLYTWINTGNIGKDKIFELFRYFSDVVTPEHWGITDIQEVEDIDDTKKRIRFVPLYRWPEWLKVDSISEQTPIKKVICPVDDCSAETYALVMRDNSMMSNDEKGQLCQDDIIFIDPNREPRRNDYVMATSSEYELASIKKLLWQDGRKCLFTSNPTWQKKFILVDDTVTLHGTVIAKSRILI